ncbi:hypothetical protein F5887DRAFT_121745 [Amanita rubescens]|nr:hypothetical protein F5887DRAFT_121745 [Amanita rubescens]
MLGHPGRTPFSIDMTDDFDLESLVHVEQSFYDSGYKDGFAHGRIHGLIEGRALGREKGFEMWEELGFYQGFALMWEAIYKQQSRSEDRATNHIKHLLNLISQFPRVNPSSLDHSAAEADLDISKLFRQIRSRYKALCATLGVRPSEAGDVTSDLDEEFGAGNAPRKRNNTVWEVNQAELEIDHSDASRKQRPPQPLSF